MQRKRLRSSTRRELRGVRWYPEGSANGWGLDGRRLCRTACRTEPGSVRHGTASPCLQRGAARWISGPVAQRTRIPLAGIRIYLTDLSTIPDEEIRAWVTGKAAWLALSLLSLKCRREPDLIERLLESAALIADVSRQPTGLKALEILLHDWFATADEELTPDRFRDVLGAADLQQPEETIMTLADRLRREGRIEGHKEGLKEASRQNLLRLLETRFGALSGSVLDQIGEAEIEDLDRWFDLALGASGLEEVFDTD